MSLIFDRLAPQIVKLNASKILKQFAIASKDLRAHQESVLLDILSQQAQTTFGKKHNFSQIKSIKDFQTNVGVLDYEDLRPYILQQDKTKNPELTSQKTLFYAVTSGTTGEPKYIPVHQNALAYHKAAKDVFLYSVLKSKPKVLSGKIFAIVSPAEEGRMLDSNIPFGSTSGQMYQGLPKILQKKYVVPAEVFDIEDYDLKYLTILRLAIQEEDITYISTANPSTLVELASVLNANKNEMIRDLLEGSFFLLQKLSPKVQKAVSARLKSAPKRAQKLSILDRKNNGLKFKDLWPKVQAVGTWTGGSCKIFIEQIKPQFDSKVLIRDIGYLSSEFRGSIPAFDHTTAGVPTILSNFFEFVETDKWNDGVKEFLSVDQIKDGQSYYVFITTSCGLYRYHMNDIIEVEGFYKNVPLIRFVQKGKGVTSITGEKLYESQVINSVKKAESALGLDSVFFIMSCNPNESQYTLYFEPSNSAELSAAQANEFKEIVEKELTHINLEYYAKLKSGRIRPLKLEILKAGTYENYKVAKLKQGQREGQFKIVALQYQKDIGFIFESHIIESTLK